MNFIENLNIRKATIDDARIVLELVKTLVSELDGTPLTIDNPVTIPVLRNWLESEQYLVQLAEDSENKIIGIITLVESKAVYAGGTFGVIQEFYIVPNQRSQSVGRHLLDAAKKEYKERGWRRLEVGAPAYPQWARTKAFYLKEGFEEVGPKLKWTNPG